VQIFESGRPIIAWLRVADYQIISLKQIVAQLLNACPSYRSSANPRLYVTGELSRQRIELRRPVVLAVSPYNPGADLLGNELVSFLKGMKGSNMLTFRPTAVDTSEVTQRSETQRSESFEGHSESSSLSSPRRPPWKMLAQRKAHLGRNSVLTRVQSRFYPTQQQFSTRVASRFCEGAPAADATHLLLYLSKMTFVGRMGAVLAEEVREARLSGIKVLLAHENDRERGGVEFETFLRATPDDLISDQIFGPIATPLATGDHRAVSLMHLLKDLGAVTSRRHLAIITRPTLEQLSSSAVPSARQSSKKSSGGTGSPARPSPGLMSVEL
jgi:hypothetical protein